MPSLPCRPPGVSASGSDQQALCQRLALDQFHHNKSLAARLLKTVDGGDVGVIEGGKDFCFALETGQPLRIVGELVREDFDGNKAVQVGVFGTVDFAHAALAQFLNDAVVGK